ncbi:MAG: hypothetical protein A2942_02955 [Candidatus Lloydbacteria bacterium RIFCSPLOWO2_01_FULL_50_20]|uniref:Prepilin-type N-terminal cleavage/methylation domain-containing protein n=1 Tax=Candidatus Lloydbacteria bacterium RIFCSPLOWO2_01_FULL_50_20 TaxID=1798665 RepID=A0A1G2DKD6_9BACT|nr:MAG: hypothetical protein A3C13_04130 [Candidatus Lloydbacteria bacterium RIFCSPHIGHO2_02_FULL_50_11]OGZ13872.1 MAG: hypothetical protein A2942_02955 [Candidatus Lloydbacteria bacterium RIFCSPLOWO2_01_FULL_50_20]
MIEQFMKKFTQPHPVKMKRQTGFTLIEIVVAASMITISLVSIAMYYKKALDVSENTTRHIQSGFLLEEGLEAIKMLRDQSWSGNIATLSTTTTYYLYWSGTLWMSTTTPQKIENIFERSFRIAEVRRDGSDNIASSGTLDDGTRKVTVSVTWPVEGGGAATPDIAETYITNLLTN